MAEANIKKLYGSLSSNAELKMGEKMENYCKSKITTKTAKRKKPK